MEREIKFRGKRVDRNEWIYGFYWFIDEHYNPSLAKRHFVKSINNGIDFEVIPETVGQFTGLIDKNGKEIFEGDICEVVYYNHATPNSLIIQEVLFENSTFILRAKNYLGLQLEESRLYVPLYYSFAPNKIKVIGNVYETPELLK